MKNALFAIAIATAGLCAIPAISHAASDGFFVNGNIGQSGLSKGAYDDNDSGYGANIGYRWALNPSVALGVEGGYTNLGEFDPNFNFSSIPLPRAKIEGWTLGVNGHFNLSPKWYLSARGGLFRGDVKAGFVDGTTPVRIDETSNKFYAGAGFGYDFSNNFSVGLNYDYYKTDTKGLNLNPDLLSVSAEYRFSN